MVTYLCFMIIINICLNPLGFNTQVFPRSWPARNKGCVQPHSYCFIPAFACGERRKTSPATGSWRRTNAALLGVFQVTLFCPVRAEQSKPRLECGSDPVAARPSAVAARAVHNRDIITGGSRSCSSDEILKAAAKADRYKKQHPTAENCW